MNTKKYGLNERYAKDRQYTTNMQTFAKYADKTKKALTDTIDYFIFNLHHQPFKG